MNLIVDDGFLIAEILVIYPTEYLIFDPIILEQVQDVIEIDFHYSINLKLEKKIESIDKENHS